VLVVQGTGLAEHLGSQESSSCGERNPDISQLEDSVRAGGGVE